LILYNNKTISVFLIIPVELCDKTVRILPTANVHVVTDVLYYYCY